MTGPIKEGPPEKPEKEVAPPATESATHTTAEVDDHNDSRLDRQFRPEFVRKGTVCRPPVDQSTPTQLRRRREASLRLAPSPYTRRRDPSSRIVG